MERAMLTAQINKNTELWVMERDAKKSQRRKLTDVVKDFVVYAMECDSRGANNYYTLITNIDEYFEEDED